MVIVDYKLGLNLHVRAENNGWSTDNVQPDRGLDRSNSCLASHFDRSFLDTNYFPYNCRLMRFAL